MRKRSISFLLRLNESEHARLMREVKRTSLSRESYIRALINGVVPKPLPSPDYYAMMRELNAIGNNLNQIAMRAHATGHLAQAVFQEEADRLRLVVQQIQQAVTEPERRGETPTAHRSEQPP
ncbi:MobC family plasmid mobilization relaxosome protein [Paenibacillus sp. FSL K6-3166]|uniref:MobC family plasmid mobilization relaxosome protein n=1 Tax=unclassified Paenibacillus TaxID=185978 RepID=UPI000BA0E21C|nr:MobC family plasmid mobilization relaxosome protein [Paenibacillus sp. VTT E-133291]OZQ91461.1 plasmid mobilization relaxosome protein MobC [Paenibacillus sp. VTT E-133291]